MQLTRRYRQFFTSATVFPFSQYRYCTIDQHFHSYCKYSHKYSVQYGPIKALTATTVDLNRAVHKKKNVMAKISSKLCVFHLAYDFHIQSFHRQYRHRDAWSLWIEWSKENGLCWHWAFMVATTLTSQNRRALIVVRPTMPLLYCWSGSRRGHCSCILSQYAAYVCRLYSSRPACTA